MPTARLARRQMPWSSLPDDLQLALAEQALHRAAETIAVQAECLATEMQNGALADQGGSDALRLLAAVVRATCRGSADMQRH